MSHIDFYFARIAAAFVRGKLADDPNLAPEQVSLVRAPFDELSDAELDATIQLGLDAGLRLHRYKRTMGLARVARVLGVLKGLYPMSLLDIGSGRGAFLWPLLDEFPALPVTSVDLDERRVADILAVRRGGIETLDAVQADATALPFQTDAFDVVTLLEVLEHIPDAAQAVREAVRVAGRFVVASVPSREDDNPEHIHLFNQATLGAMFAEAGAGRVRCEYVLNHLIAVAKTDGA